MVWVRERGTRPDHMRLECQDTDLDADGLDRRLRKVIRN